MPGAARLKERVLKLPLRVAFASILTPLLLANVCGCTGASAKPVAAATAAHAAARTPSATATQLAFARQIGVTCDNAQEPLKCIGGRPEVGDYADVDLHPGCEAGGWFGVIGAKAPVELRDRISPLDTSTTATLHAGQTVCIQAIGRAGRRPFYYFVTALPAALVPRCDTNDACTTPAALSAQRAYRLSNPGCRAAAAEALHACASGWMWADDLQRLPSPSDAP